MTLEQRFQDVDRRMADERDRQILKWGQYALDYDHKPWMTILMEEVGEVARADLQQKKSIREELIQVAAVATFWAAELTKTCV